MQLQEPIYDHRSQDATAEALMWLQEQCVAAGIKIWLNNKLLKSSWFRFCLSEF